MNRGMNRWRIFPPTPLWSYVLVGLQLVFLGLILITGPLIAGVWGTRVMEVLGVALGLWALGSMAASRINILPDIRAGSILITAGPYRYIRHPMYAAVLLFTLALVLDEFSWFRCVVWILLFTDLVAKLTYEERLLTQHFEDYREYQRRTKRLVPFVF